MDKIKIGIVEDEVIIADHLQSLLTGLGYEVAAPAASFQEAIAMIEKETPDILLLDIQLKGKRDGIDLALLVKEKYRLPFIFLTANADPATVQRAKQAGPHAYLIKPFSRDDLYTAIEICLHNFSGSHTKEQTAAEDYIINDAIFIKAGQHYHKVKFTDILYLQSEHVYVQVFTSTQKFLVRTSLSQYLLQFNERHFVRIHRSYVVHVEHIQTFNTEEVIINGISLPVSKTYADDLFKKLGIG